MRELVDLNHPVYLPTYDECYVCGQSHPRGLRVRFFVGAFGQVHTRFRPDYTQTSYEDIVHGGVISTLLDELLGWPISLQTGRVSFTGELTVRFIKPMSVGRTYLATALPGTDRAQYWEGEGDIRDEQGQIYAQARGKYFLLSAEQTAAVAETLTYQPGDPPVLRYKSQIEGGEQGATQGLVHPHQRQPGSTVHDHACSRLVGQLDSDCWSPASITPTSYLPLALAEGATRPTSSCAASRAAR
jgi:uncharacterized protein (TIGR00369 family)